MMSQAGIDARPLLKVEHLKKYFPVATPSFVGKRSYLHAVDDISFAIFPGETFGLVGESGCGKTTTGRLALRLSDPTAGSIVFDGRDISHLRPGQLRALRREMQIIFQDAYSSFDLRMPVGEIVGEPLRVHHMASGKAYRERIAELLTLVGLKPENADDYPHELSSGQRQCVGIARSLALGPKFVVADEPVSALDVSVRAQVLNLLLDLQDRLGLTYLFISHDMSVIRHVADRIGVMYVGRLVEIATKNQFFAAPLHPYSQALLQAVPIEDPDLRHPRRVLEGDVPSPVDPKPGCRFAGRCPMAQAQCYELEPTLVEKTPGHFVACHYV